MNGEEFRVKLSKNGRYSNSHRSSLANKALTCRGVFFVGCKIQLTKDSVDAFIGVFGSMGQFTSIDG